MEGEDELEILWQGHSVGFLQNLIPDMWYLEGNWVSNSSKEAEAFESAARTLDAKAAFNNLQKGIEVSLKEKEQNANPTLGVIISLTEGNVLFLRRIAISYNK